jgi:hypothetical protein
MTNLDDFDRSLAEFLADGPNTAPEAPVIAAMAHARTTPRRPDLLRAFRADPMARRRGVFAGGRPGLVLAVVLVAVAGIGVAVVGSRQPGFTIPTPSANDVSTPAPTASSSPTPTGPSAFSADVMMLVSAGQPYPVSVSDITGDVVGVTSLQPGDGASVGPTDIQVITDPADAAAFVVTWQGMPCETAGSVRVDETAKIIEVGRQQCGGDALPLDRILRLQFRSGQTAGDWSSTFVEVPDPSAGPDGSPSAAIAPLGPPSVAPVHVALKTQGGNPASVDVVDESGQLTKAVSGTLPEIVTEDWLGLVNESPTRIRVGWSGSPCDTVHRLTIDPDLATLTIDRPRCFGDAIAAMRSLLLTFAAPVDAGSLDLVIVDGRGGVDMPTWTATAPDSAGGRYDIVLDDPGHLVTALGGGYDPEVDAVGAGPTGIQVVHAYGTTLRLIWRSPACATSPSLTIDPSGRQWQLANTPCSSSAADVLRMVEVDLSVPADEVLPSVEAIVVSGS